MNKFEIRKSFASKVIPKIDPRFSFRHPELCTITMHFFAAEAKVVDESSPQSKAIAILLKKLEALFKEFLEKERLEDPAGIIAQAFTQGS